MKVVLLVAAVVGMVAGQVTLPGTEPCDCRPLVLCSYDSYKGVCILSDGGAGVCCRRGQPKLDPVVAALGGDGSLISPDRTSFFEEPLPMVPRDVLDNAIAAGAAAVTNLINLENSMIQANLVLRNGTPASNHLRQSRINPQAREIDREAYNVVSITKFLVDELNLTPREAGLRLRNEPVAQISAQSSCPQQVSCNFNSPYRTADGSCNNPYYPHDGMRNTPLQRVLPPTYDDGVSTFRTRAKNGGWLPNVRKVSKAIIPDMDKPNPKFTLSVMQWAQFMDHDFAHVPFPSLSNGDGIECCTSPPPHPSCRPIDVSMDSFYSSFGVTCMNFVRSMLDACTYGYAEQLNQLTHWIDGSMVYGSSLAEQLALRTMSNGKLKTTTGNLLPLDTSQGGACDAQMFGTQCYLAGDSRVNEQPGLTVIHTLWVREHNRIATKLQQLNPSWSDEVLFQETRRIVVAEIQHITFKEWLPIILGPSFINYFGLGVLSTGYSNAYYTSIYPNMFNEFSTAAFRFGHTLVQGKIAMFSSTGSVTTQALRDNFNSPHLIQKQNRFDDLVRSLTQFPSQTFDNFVTVDLTNHLFQPKGFNFGMDLMSLNIHRGRDHGIATYNSMRQECGLTKANTFADLSGEISPALISALQSQYASVDDIDLFVGGLCETPQSQSLLGLTFTCIIGEQFARLKKGDRFFYDLGGQAGSFSPAQLQEIRKSSWARIICDNSGLSAVQPRAFELSTALNNNPQSCTSSAIPSMDLTKWDY